MEIKNAYPTKAAIRKALGKIGDQDIKTKGKPTEVDYLKELATLKGVSPTTEPETLKDVLKNVLENERLNEEEKKKAE
ncbi:MAG: hypothetical protein Q8L51_02925 [Candidatus Amesbacteria bacterium]|nr:hypothetical protein [Candidatus Amesbacteria bacterium]